MGEQDAGRLVDGLRRTFDSGRTRPIAWRQRQLSRLDELLKDHEDVFLAALGSDLGKAPTESFVTEVAFLRSELAHARRNLRRWLRPRRVPVPAVAMPARASTVLEPLGVALIIAPWNYPLMLALSPLIGALAAGDAVIVKPSELAPDTSRAIADLLPRYLDPEAVAVVEGGVDETTALLAQRFDTIFYTGSGRVGRIVMEAAAKHLTPVTLELGGKSPAYVDDAVDLRVVARRLVWGKFIAAGQTCVAPDYIMASPATARRLAPLLADAVAEQYGTAIGDNSDYARIVDERQFDRLVSLLDDGTVASGGRHDRTRLFIEPTVLTGVAPDSAVMHQEIFGPILPVVEVTDADDAIARITAGDKPLALYVFSDDAETRRRFVTRTSSGAIVFDAAVIHLSVPGLPFGGVGASGMGGYHGRRSVEVFSHEKALLSKPLTPDTLALLRPPYTAKRIAIVRALLGR
ncbi:aldehyde dehydrogenase family protein [Herbiconiux sp. L3-i23]|uniref:aldehyde dehydrogenase family protein n=1 Tax=Herbiconiux sp. L3-i23 TaxID=2905871 RepID=UPI0020732FDF|nr:aldehyde dehydrogenase family protein [Herbiconiux sp. L3-i23]